MPNFKYTPEHHHRKHRNVLYSLVILLAIMQIASFTILSIQTSKINSLLESTSKELTGDIEKTAFDQQTYTTQLVETYDSLYQANFREISQLLTDQQEDVEQQIRMLQSSQEDFSGVIEEAVKSVVTVSTGGSIGSGFIVNSGGYVVTNYHVIDGASVDNIRVLTYSRDILEAEYIGKDEQRDLALLRLPGDGYPTLTLADSDDLQVGRKVIAIGNPLGLAFTVTEGIISGLDRRGPNGLNEYIQTDVSLNPGNSGGPLIDLQGEVVGINNFKIGDAEALGFALESNPIRTSINIVANETIIP